MTLTTANPTSRRTVLRGAAGATGVALVGPHVDSGHAHASALPAMRVPHEARPHRRTWMAWPDSPGIWGRSHLGGVQRDIARIARAISRFEPVWMLANSASVAAARRACGPRVTVLGDIEIDDCWIRDTGPVFRINGHGKLDAIGTNFNGWGGRQDHDRDSHVAAAVAELIGVTFTQAGFVGEGGAIETDGRGTLMATESSLVNPNRNPGVSRAAVAAAMCAAYGARTVIWLPGVAGRDITDDHVDATSRILRPGLAVVQVPPSNERGIWARNQRQQRRMLRRARTADGNSITVRDIDGPRYARIRPTDPSTVASYANYYLCNGAVISAEFGDASADRRAAATLRKLFPRRVVVQLRIDHLARGGGGIHCVTQQQPRREVSDD